MTKIRTAFINLLICTLIISCAEPTTKQVQPPSPRDSTTSTQRAAKEYRAIRYVDSFMNANSAEIKKSSALKENYEGLCTKRLLPLIDKKGFYNDIPFTLVATTINNGKAYGNFVYDEGKYFIKVQCIIKKKQLDSLIENETYLIKFKPYKFEEGVSFENSFSKIELPTVDAYLINFKRNNE